MIPRISEDLQFYVVIFGGYVEGSVVFLFAVYALLAAVTRGRARPWRTFARYSTFNVCLLLSGMFGAALSAAASIGVSCQHCRSGHVKYGAGERQNVSRTENDVEPITRRLDDSTGGRHER